MTTILRFFAFRRFNYIDLLGVAFLVASLPRIGVAWFLTLIAVLTVFSFIVEQLADRVKP